MAPARVYLVSARATKWSYRESLAGRFEGLLRDLPLSAYFEENQAVAVKTHFGSEGAHQPVRPLFIRKVVEEVRRGRGRPFVTDTFRIKGLEYLETANQNGINALSCGAPVVLADGIFGRDNVRVPSGDVQGEVLVASAIHDADAMVVLSHFKGHVNAGVGGAIKNVAMGGLSGASRDRDWRHGRGGMHAHHMEGEITWKRELCTECLQCVEVCPLDACSMDEGGFAFDRKKCWRCGRCTRVCPEGALDLPFDQESFHRGLAQAAAAVLSTFAKGRVLFVNFLLDIQPECDCMPAADVPVVQDVGILVSDDPVAVDQASLDLVRANPPLPGSAAQDKGIAPGQDVFLLLHQVDGQRQIDHAAEVGLGTKEYEFVKK